MANRIFSQMRRHKKGVALIITLAVLTILSLLGITFSMLSGIERGIAKNYVDQVRAKIMAQNGIEDAIFKLRFSILDSGNTPSEQMNAMFATPEGSTSINSFANSWIYKGKNPLKPDLSTPLENATYSSFVYVNDKGWPWPIKINGVLTYFSGFMDTSTYGAHSDIYSLKVMDCSGMLYINDGVLAGPTSPTTLNMKRILNKLGELLLPGGGTLANGLKLGCAIIDNRPTNGWKDKYQLVNGGYLTKDEFNKVKNFITAHSWVDDKVVNPVPLSSTVISQYSKIAADAKHAEQNIGSSYYRTGTFKALDYYTPAGDPLTMIDDKPVFKTVNESIYRYGASTTAGAGRSLATMPNDPMDPTNRGPIRVLVSPNIASGNAPLLQWYPKADETAPTDHGNIVWGYDELNPVWIETVSRAPVNINTAPYEVLIALVSDLQGFFMVERRRDAPLRALPGTKKPDQTLSSGDYSWMAQQFYYSFYSTDPSTITARANKLQKNGIDALGYLYKTVPIRSGYPTSATPYIVAEQIAAEMIYCRSKQNSPITGINYSSDPKVWWSGSFKTWRQFNRFVDALVWHATEGAKGNKPTLSDGEEIGTTVLFKDDRTMYVDYAFKDDWSNTGSAAPDPETEVLSALQQQYASQAIADTLKANFNPNCHLNELNPDANLFTMVDKTDLITNSTEACFTPMGYFEIECLARILQPTNDNGAGVESNTSLAITTTTGGVVSQQDPIRYDLLPELPNNIVRAQKRISAIIKLFDIYRETTQRDFYGGDMPDHLDKQNHQEVPPGSYNPPVAKDFTNSNKALEIGPEVAQGNLGDPTSDDATLDPKKSQYLPVGVEYDGYITLSTYGADHDRIYDKELAKGSYNSSLMVNEGGNYQEPQRTTPGDINSTFSWGDEETSSVIHSHFQFDTHSHYNASQGKDSPETRYRMDMAWGNPVSTYSSWTRIGTPDFVADKCRGWIYPIPTYSEKWPLNAATGARPDGSQIYCSGNPHVSSAHDTLAPHPMFVTPAGSAADPLIGAGIRDRDYDNTNFTSADGNIEKADMHDPQWPNTGYSPDYSYWYGYKDMIALKKQEDDTNRVGALPKIELANNTPDPTEWQYEAYYNAGVNQYQSSPYGPYEFYDPDTKTYPADLKGKYRLAHSFRLPPWTSGTSPSLNLDLIAPSDLRTDGVYSERNSGVAYWIDEGVSWDSMHGVISMWVKPGFYPEMSGKPRVWFSASRWHYEGSEYVKGPTASGGYNPTAFGLFFLPAHHSDAAGANITEAINSLNNENYSYNTPGAQEDGPYYFRTNTNPTKRGGIGKFPPASLGFGFGFHQGSGYNEDFNDPYTSDKWLDPAYNDPVNSANGSVFNRNSFTSKINGIMSNTTNYPADDPAVPNIVDGGTDDPLIVEDSTIINAADTTELDNIFTNGGSVYQSMDKIDANNNGTPDVDELKPYTMGSLKKLLQPTGGNPGTIYSFNGLQGGVEGGFLTSSLNHIGHNDRYPGGVGTGPGAPYNPIPNGGFSHYISDHRTSVSTDPTPTALAPANMIDRPSLLRGHQWTHIIAKWTVPKQLYPKNAGGKVTIPGRWIWNMWVNGQDFRYDAVTGKSAKELSGINSIVGYKDVISYPYRRPHFSIQSFQPPPPDGKDPPRFNPTSPNSGAFSPSTVPVVTVAYQSLPAIPYTEQYTVRVPAGFETQTLSKTEYIPSNETVTYPAIEWILQSRPVETTVLDRYETRTEDVQVFDHWETVTYQVTVDDYGWVASGTKTNHSGDVNVPTNHSGDFEEPNMVWGVVGSHPETREVQNGWNIVMVWDPIAEAEVSQLVPNMVTTTVTVPDYGWVASGTKTNHSGDVAAYTNHSGDFLEPNMVWQKTGSHLEDRTRQDPVYRVEQQTIQVPIYKTIIVSQDVWVPNTVWRTTTVTTYDLNTSTYTKQVEKFTMTTVTENKTRPGGTVPVPDNSNPPITAQVWQVQDVEASTGKPTFVVGNTIRLGEISSNGFKHFSRNYCADATIDEFYLWKEGEAANSVPGKVPSPTTAVNYNVNFKDPSALPTDAAVDYATFPNNAGGSGSPNINNAFKLWYKGRYFKPNYTSPISDALAVGYTNLSSAKGHGPDPDVTHMWNDGSAGTTAIGLRPGYESQFKSQATKITVVKNGKLVGGVVKGGLARYMPPPNNVTPPGGTFSYTGAATAEEAAGHFKIFGLSWSWYGEGTLDKTIGSATAGTPYILDYKNFLPSDVLSSRYVLLPMVNVSVLTYASNTGTEYGRIKDTPIQIYSWAGNGSEGGNYKDGGAFASTMVKDLSFSSDGTTLNAARTPIEVSDIATVKYRVHFLFDDSDAVTSSPNLTNLLANSILLSTPVFDDITFYLDTGQQIVSYTIVE